MARSYPADTKLQSFISEQYDKETTARLNFYFETREKEQQGRKIEPTERKRCRGSTVPDGLPQLVPMEFARKQKREEDLAVQKIIEKARKEQKQEIMFKPPRRLKDQLYDGFTKEEKGRYQYLKCRKEVIPEQKYSYPLVSSMVYGWKTGEQSAPARPRYARSTLIHNTFYTRNKIPTMEDPNTGFTFERSKTIFC